jgi:hypothetical protein
MDPGAFWLLVAAATTITLVVVPRNTGLHIQCVLVAIAIIVLLIFEDCAEQREYHAKDSPATALAKQSEVSHQGEEMSMRRYTAARVH